MAVLRNALESGVEEQRERKNKSKVTQELVEKKRVTYTNEERRENSKVKEYEKWAT